MTSLQQQQARSRVLSGGSSLHTRSVSTSSLLCDENARSKASVLNTGKSVAAVTGKPRVVLGDLTNAAAAAGNADKQIKKPVLRSVASSGSLSLISRPSSAAVLTSKPSLYAMPASHTRNSSAALPTAHALHSKPTVTLLNSQSVSSLGGLRSSASTSLLPAAIPSYAVQSKEPQIGVGELKRKSLSPLKQKAQENVPNSPLKTLLHANSRRSSLVSVKDQRNSHLLVLDYAQDILQHFRNTEHRSMVAATYMASQPDLNSKMREILVDWLLNVHSRFNLLPETMFLAVIILDRFLEKQPINRTKLQLAGCAALLLASKYEEISCPQVSDFVHVTDNTYSKQQILQMEALILNVLDFRMTVTSSLRFCESFIQSIDFTLSSSTLLTNLCEYLLSLTLQHMKFLAYPPSMLAAAALYLSLHSTHVTLCTLRWDAALAQYTGYSAASMSSCIRDLYACYETANNGTLKYNAVVKKFMKAKHNEVAKITIKSPNME